MCNNSVEKETLILFTKSWTTKKSDFQSLVVRIRRNNALNGDEKKQALRLIGKFQ